MAKPKPLALPTKKSTPKLSLWDNPSLIYGPPKVGKTTLASQAPKALILATEPGTHALSVYDMEIRSWTRLLEALTLVREGQHDYQTIVIDTIDNAWEYLCADVAKRFSADTIGDIPHGKGWSIAKAELRKTLEGLARLPYGVMLISHSVDRDMQPKNAPQYTKTTPTLPNSARQVVMALCSYIFLADYETTDEVGADGQKITRRVLRTKPSAAWDAGDRSGKLPAVIPLDFNELTAAFAAIGGA